MAQPQPIPLNRPTAALGVSNAVLRARACTHQVRDFPGPLSIKSVTAGTVAWKTGGRELVVDRDSFLVLNAGEPYSMNIDSRRPVATLCVFFENGFVEGVRGAMQGGDLEQAFAPARFSNRLHLGDDLLLPRMRALAQGPHDRLWLDAQYLALAAELLQLDRDFQRRLYLMPARKAGTREELFKRVRRGQEYLHAHPATGLDLASLAREACLSPYHFHRAFSALYGTTPHQYRNRLRLQQARRLLEDREASVTTVCSTVGFESPASFSLLFRRAYGVPPSQIRKIR